MQNNFHYLKFHANIDKLVNVSNLQIFYETDPSPILSLPRRQKTRFKRNLYTEIYTAVEKILSGNESIA